MTDKPKQNKSLSSEIFKNWSSNNEMIPYNFQGVDVFLKPETVEENILIALETSELKRGFMSLMFCVYDADGNRIFNEDDYDEFLKQPNNTEALALGIKLHDIKGSLNFLKEQIGGKGVEEAVKNLEKTTEGQS